MGLVQLMVGVIVADVTNKPLFNPCINHPKSKFLIVSMSPFLGHFSAGELNVI